MRRRTGDCFGVTLASQYGRVPHLSLARSFMAYEQNWSEVCTKHVPASFLLGTKESLLRGRTVKRDRLGKTVESVAVNI